MNKAASRYLRALKKALPLLGRSRREVLKKFRPALEAFCQEEPNPSENALHQAFGTPAEMVRVLTAQVPESVLARCKTCRRTAKAAAVCAAAALLLFAVYVFLLKDIPLISKDYAIVYTGQTPTNP